MTRKMKDSGIEWIGKIPEGWKTLKIKNIIKNKGIKNCENEQVLSLYRDLGIVIKSSRDDNHNKTSEKTENYKYVEPNDLVVNKMKAWQGSIAVSKYKGIVSPAYYVCTFTTTEISPFYIHYLLRSSVYIPEYRRLSGGIRPDQWDLSYENFRNIPVVVPSLNEQIRIVGYLDQKCDKIDTVIDKQKKVIEKLKAFKQSVITEAVTKGLNPNAKMKKSGIEWIGEIPEHWEIYKLKKLTSILTCGYAATPEYVDEGIPFLSAQNVKNGKLDLSKYNCISYDLHQKLIKYKKPQKGDIFQVRVGATIGQACILDCDLEVSIYVSLTHIRANNLVENYYLSYILGSEIFIDAALNATYQGGGVGNLNVKDLREMYVTIPTISEQHEISEFLNKKCSKIDMAVTKKEMLIQKLIEYKKNLIYECVTGKREV